MAGRCRGEGAPPSHPSKHAGCLLGLSFVRDACLSVTLRARMENLYGQFITYSVFDRDVGGLA
jgi:hypothetical protein